jgi:hypothetical protein
LTRLKVNRLGEAGLRYRYSHVDIRETGIDEAGNIKMDQITKSWSKDENPAYLGRNRLRGRHMADGHVPSPKVHPQAEFVPHPVVL